MIPKTWDHFTTRKEWKAAGKGLAEGKCKDCKQKERLDELNRTLGCNPTDTDTTRMCSSCDQPKEMSSSFTNKEWKKQSGKSKRNACHASGDGKESEQVTEDTSKTSSDSDSDAPLFLIDRIGSTGNPHSDVNEAEKKRSHEAETSDLAERAKKKPRLEETERALPIERACSMCKVRKTREYFSKTKWKAAGKGLEDGKCKVCVEKWLEATHGVIQCFLCKEQKKPSEFSKKQRKRDNASCKACSLLYNNNINMSEVKMRQEQEEEGAVPGGWNLERKRSHFADIADPAKKKPRLSTAAVKKTAPDSDGVGTEYHKEVAPDEVPNGTAAAAAASFFPSAVARGRGVENRPAWMAQGLCAGSAAFSAPVISRGRVRGIDNRPAWMTRGLGGDDHLSGQLSQMHVQDEVRVKNEVYVKHEVHIHEHEAPHAMKQGDPYLPSVKEEHYSFNNDDSVWV